MNRKSKIIILIASILLLIFGSVFFYTYSFNQKSNVNAKCARNVNYKKPVFFKTVKTIKEINGLVRVKDIDSSIMEDLKYATVDNFTKKIIYPFSVCVLQKNTAEKLKKANEEFLKRGYSIKIWDAYRPVYVQKIFWNMVKDNRYVANPYNGSSKHNRGTAVDMTLIDRNGKEIDMPSHFDDFSKRAWRSNDSMTEKQRQNLIYMTECMEKYGFKTLETEWWHFDDIDYKKYSVVDVDLEKFR